MFPSVTCWNFILIDSRNGDYSGLDKLTAIAGKGLKIIDAELVASPSSPYLDPVKVSEILLSLV